MIVISVLDKWGCINGKGEIIHPVEYDRIQSFHSGYSTTRIGDRHFILDLAGNSIEIKGAIDLKDIMKGYATYREGDFFGIVDSTGQTVVEPKFLKIGTYINGFAWARDNTDKIGFINGKGEWIIEPRYDKAENPDGIYGVVTAAIGNDFYLNYADGYSVKLENIYTVGEFISGYAWARVGDQNGVINYNGEWIIPAKHKKITIMPGGTIGFRDGILWGAYNYSGDLLFEPTYIRLEEIHEGLMGAQKDKLWGFLDAKGNVVIDFQRHAFRDFKNGYAAVRIGYDWGLIDSKGNLIAKPSFKRIKDVEIIP